jgi:hypothetical protein
MKIVYYSLSFLLSKIFYELFNTVQAVLITLLYAINNSSGMLLHSQDTSKLQTITIGIVKAQDQTYYVIMNYSYVWLHAGYGGGCSE